MNPQSDPDYYRRIDFPVSPTWADHYEAQGAVVHKNFVKGDSRISATISPDTAQMLAKIMDNQAQAFEAVHTRIDDQAKQIDKIKDYLRGQHEERKQENAFRKPQLQTRKEAMSNEMSNEGLDL